MMKILDCLWAQLYTQLSFLAALGCLKRIHELDALSAAVLPDVILDLTPSIMLS